MNLKVAKIVIGLPVEGPFDYKITPDQQSLIKKGQRVSVLFNRRKAVGYVVDIRSSSKFKDLNPILSILDGSPSLDENALKFTKAFSEYYGCSWGEAIESYLPGVLRAPRTLAQEFTPPAPKAEGPKPRNILLNDAGQDKRWEVIIREISAAIIQKGGVIFLVPEAALLEDIEEKLKKFLPGIRMTAYDRKLSTQEEVGQWVSIRKGEFDVVLGTRSAVFAPVGKLKLIIVYDEDNAAYKQEQSPHYHADKAANLRSGIEGCKLLFVSSLPSVESWHKAKREKWDIVEYHPENLAKVEPIDLTNFNTKVHSFLSFPLQNKMYDALRNKGKIILFINRRGYEITMQETLERFSNRVSRFFPQARVASFYKETKELPKDFDILIATQAVFRMREQFRVSLAAMINFDDELNRMDFRSSQKALACLLHLRRLAEHTLVVQTHMPDNYCVKAAKLSGFAKFYSHELKLRRELKLPPFQHIVAVVLRGEKEQAVTELANELFRKIESLKDKDLEATDPHPLAVLRNKYRFSIILKGSKVKNILALIRKSLKDLKKRQRTIVTVNVDP